PADEGFKQQLAEVIDARAWGIGGPKQAQFVEQFAEFCGTKYCVACTNGTTALELALRAAGVGPGDEVIVPPYTFIATASAVISVGAIPIFADIEPDTFCLDPSAFEAAITEYTAAVIPVHIGGMPANMDAVLEIARKHGLKVIEDAAQAHGARYGDRRVGGIGDAGCFSFQSSKNITAGEGGAVTTNDPDVYATAWSLHNVGRVPEGEWYDHRVLGWNLRMTEFQAGLLLRGMELWPEQDERRQRSAAHLRKRLEEIPGIEPQAFSPGATKSAYHLFICRYDAEAFDGLSRDRFLQALAAEGIPAARGYNPLYREPMFAGGLDMDGCPFACKFYKGHVDYSTVKLPVVEHLCENGSFWMGQTVLLGDESDMDAIADAMAKIYEHRAELLEE
ncbi:MAG: DegT/DnrJ/EryC1/StrS family aminotransferase, partial [Armatimonadetes bacterium]|nr:DegT/DnrJ/EryC1/StrS family aminotransferase [Armatimonadota bacterium]